MSLAESAFSAALPLAVQSLARPAEPPPLDDVGLERAFVEAQADLSRNTYAAPSDGIEAKVLFCLLGLVAGLYAGKKLV